jgi:hypothetical protein
MTPSACVKNFTSFKPRLSRCGTWPKRYSSSPRQLLKSATANPWPTTTSPAYQIRADRRQSCALKSGIAGPTYTALKSAALPTNITFFSTTSRSPRGSASLAWQDCRLIAPASSRLVRGTRRHSRSFALVSGDMAIKIDGTAIAKKIRERLGAEIVEKQKANPRYRPCLKIVQGPYRPVYCVRKKFCTD